MIYLYFITLSCHFLQTDLPDPVREDITVLQRENSELTNRVLEMEDELKQLRRLVHCKNRN